MIERCQTQGGRFPRYKFQEVWLSDNTWIAPVRAGFFAVAIGLVLAVPATAAERAISTSPESLGFSPQRLQRIGCWYQARVDAGDLSGKDAGDLSGAVVGVTKDGKLSYLQAVGFQDRAKTIPMKRDSIVWIASMTKPVTSVAAMMLVEAGKLDLDAPVANYLPDLKDMRVGSTKTDTATGKVDIALESAKRPMTVRDLLRHTSGLVYPPQFLSSPISVSEFYVDDVDHTRIAFVRDSTGRAMSAVLNPGPWELRGQLLRKSPI